MGKAVILFEVDGYRECNSADDDKVLTRVDGLES